MKESAYQNRIIRKLSDLLPGSVIIKNDPEYIQGIPDLLILYLSKWAMLEVKTSADSAIQPNQDYYVDLFNTMSFAAFIYPEIEEEVLHDLQRSLCSGRTARFS